MNRRIVEEEFHHLEVKSSEIIDRRKKLIIHRSKLYNNICLVAWLTTQMTREERIKEGKKGDEERFLDH